MDVAAILTELNQQYCDDFKTTFTISANATIRCRNVDLPNFTAFVHKWRNFFLQHEVMMNQVLPLQPAAYGDIGTVNDNKNLVLRLYGLAFSVYIKACRFLHIQPDDHYGAMVVVAIDG